MTARHICRRAGSAQNRGRQRTTEGPRTRRNRKRGRNPDHQAHSRLVETGRPGIGKRDGRSGTPGVRRKMPDLSLSHPSDKDYNQLRVDRRTSGDLICTPSDATRAFEGDPCSAVPIHAQDLQGLGRIRIPNTRSVNNRISKIGKLRYFCRHGIVLYSPTISAALVTLRDWRLPRRTLVRQRRYGRANHA